MIHKRLSQQLREPLESSRFSRVFRHALNTSVSKEFRLFHLTTPTILDKTYRVYADTYIMRTALLSGTLAMCKVDERLPREADDVIANKLRLSIQDYAMGDEEVFVSVDGENHYVYSVDTTTKETF